MRKKFFIVFTIIILLLMSFGVIDSMIVKSKKTKELATNSKNIIEIYEEVYVENTNENHLELETIESEENAEQEKIDIAEYKKEEIQSNDKKEQIEEIKSENKSSNDGIVKTKEVESKQEDLQNDINCVAKEDKNLNYNDNSNTNEIKENEMVDNSNEKKSNDKKSEHVHSEIGTMRKMVFIL